MPKATNDAQLLIQSMSKAYAATPTNLKIIDLYVVFAIATAVIQLNQHRSVTVLQREFHYSRPLTAHIQKQAKVELQHNIGEGGLHGNSRVLSLQLFPLRRSFLCRNCSTCCLPSHSSQQREQGIQGSST